MKNTFILSLIAMVATSCVVEAIVEQSPELQTVTVSAGMGVGTRAGVSDAGSFTWHADDAISVMATDGNYYTMNLTDGAGTKQAEFTGSLPQGVFITTVATYPATVANGTAADIYSEGVLTYTLPSEYTYKDGYANVPMISTFDEAAESLPFMHIGALVRIPLNGMPANSKIQVIAKNRKIAGAFTLSTDKVGTPEGAIATQTIDGNDVVTINYTNERAGGTAEINVPLPVGVYEDMTVSVRDDSDNEVFTKTWSLNTKEFKRANLLVMEPEQVGPMCIVDVYPYFVDTRVFWSKSKGAEAYALYIDNSNDPIIVAVEELNEENGIYNYVIGGDFEHGTTHTVAVAPVVKGKVDATAKSQIVNFTTGRIMQMTNNTGSKFVCVGWDDVAIGVENSTVYDAVTKRWSLVPETAKSNRNLRGYRVRLYAEDKETILYEEVPFSGQVDYGGAFSNSSWIGKRGGANVLLPTALSFGWLEPGKKYYFQVQTLAEPVVFNSPGTDCFEPNTAGYSVSSTRGGSAWSKMVEVTTNAEHLASDKEVFYEGFEDMFFNNDLMNLAPAVVPQVLTQATAKGKEGEDAKGGYVTNTTTASAYKTWIHSLFADRKFSEQGFNTSLSAYAYGMVEKYTAEANLREFNEKAGSLNGWSVQSNKYDYRNVIPSFGNVRLGQSSSSTGAAYVTLFTPAIKSAKLTDDTDTPCVVTIRVCGHTTNSERVCANVGIYKYRGGQKTSEASIYTFSQDELGDVTPQWANNNTWTDGSNYTHYPEWYEVKAQLYLRNGDVIAIDKYNPTINGTKDYYKGVITIDDLLVELGTLDTEIVGERFYGTAPNNTNYDVWGLNGELPVTFWMGPPVLDAMNVDALTDEEIDAIKTAYFDPIVEGGYNLVETTNPYPNSMKKILEWCQQSGVKLLDKSIQSISYDGNVSAQATAHMTRLSEYASSTSYGGAYVGPDEPGICQYSDIDIMNDAFVSMVSDKAHIVNLLPSYANEAQISFGASKSCSGVGHSHSTITSYETYVRNFVNVVSVNCVFFDHYCLKKSTASGVVSRGEVKSKQYYDLDIFRHYSLEKGIPFLMITHGRPQWEAGYGSSGTATAPTTEKPTSHVYDEQRWLVWSQLALGSKGVSYFCYWTPGGFSGGPFSWTTDGQKTRMYDILKDINQEIKPIGKILMKCHADGAIMTNPTGNFALYENEGKGLYNYGPVLSLAKGNSEDVVAGCFRDAMTGEYKVLVTHEAPATTDEEASTASIATLRIDTNMATSVKLHTVTLGNNHDSAATTVVTEQNVSDGTLTLNIPDGTAVLVEFPETANQNYN